MENNYKGLRDNLNKTSKQEKLSSQRSPIYGGDGTDIRLTDSLHLEDRYAFPKNPVYVISVDFKEGLLIFEKDLLI